VTFNRPFIIRHGSQEEKIKHACCSFIQNLEPEEGREFEVTIKVYKPSKTREQLGYYFSTLVPIAASEFGLTKQEAHEALKVELLTPIVAEGFKGRITYYRSVSKMKVDEMSQYIDQCIIFLASQGLTVPSPQYRGIPE